MNICPNRHSQNGSLSKDRTGSNSKQSWDSKINLINKKKRKNNNHNLILPVVQGHKRDQRGLEPTQEIRITSVL